MRSLTTMKTRDNSAISRSRCSGRTECILGLVVWSVLLNLSCSRTKVALIGRQTIQKVDIKLHQQNDKKKDEKMVLSLLPPNITYDAEQERHALQNTWWDTLDLGWSSPPSQWLLDMCSEVVAHFNQFPSFKERDPKKLKFLPIFSTGNAAHAVCIVKVVQIAAASINAKIYLHTGSHLGTVMHGQPIPWDNDVDLTIELQKNCDFEKICWGNGWEVHPSGVRLRCVWGFNALKVWLHPPGHQKMTTSDKEWYSPFVDLFAYKIGEGKLKEVFLDQNSHMKPSQMYLLTTDYFLTRSYYFAGIHVLRPQANIVESQYSFDTCKMGRWNYRIERNVDFHLLVLK